MIDDIVPMLCLLFNEYTSFLFSGSNYLANEIQSAEVKKRNILYSTSYLFSSSFSSPSSSTSSSPCPSSSFSSSPCPSSSSSSSSPCPSSSFSSSPCPSSCPSSSFSSSCPSSSISTFPFCSSSLQPFLVYWRYFSSTHFRNVVIWLSF
jgi:hypothetical protein